MGKMDKILNFETKPVLEKPVSPTMPIRLLIGFHFHDLEKAHNSKTPLTTFILCLMSHEKHVDQCFCVLLVFETGRLLGILES